MLTIKNVKAYSSLDQAGFVKEAATVGATHSQTTVYATMAGLAIAAGIAAKRDGVKAFSFDRAADAFTSGYFADKSDGSAKAMVSALGVFAKAGNHAPWDASEIAVRVFNEKAKDGKTISFTSRAGMLRKLLKDKEPTAKEFQAARPTGGNRSNTGNLKGATAGLLRSVESFGVAWLDKLDAQGKATYASILASVESFAKVYDTAEPVKPAKGKKAAEPTFAEKRKAMLAQVASLKQAKGSTKTIN
jgi:hypothetical protein